MAVSKLEVPLSDRLREALLERAAEGGYQDPVDYVQALIQADHERREELDRLLIEGIESEAEAVTHDYRANLREEVEQILVRSTAE